MKITITNEDWKLHEAAIVAAQNIARTEREKEWISKWDALVKEKKSPIIRLGFSEARRCGLLKKLAVVHWAQLSLNVCRNEIYREKMEELPHDMEPDAREKLARSWHWIFCWLYYDCVDEAADTTKIITPEEMENPVDYSPLFGEYGYRL